MRCRICRGDSDAEVSRWVVKLWNYQQYQAMRNSGTASALFLFCITFAFFGALYALWAVGRLPDYLWVMHGFGVDAWTRPFLDLSGVLSMGECHRLGIDVLHTNPCDPLHRTLNYGPPLVYLPFTTADTSVLGVAQGLMLLLAMAFVLRPRTRVELVVAVVASLSSGTIYEMERANFDAIEFAIIALSGPLTMWSLTGRLFSYGLYYAGGVFKFYPFVLLLTVLRERLTIAIGLAVVTIAMIGLYAFAYRQSFSAISASLPPFEYDSDVFGAACLPFGVADWLKLPDLVGDALMIVLVASFGVVAGWMVRRIRGEMRKTGYDGLNFHYLLTGSIVVLGCFFLRPNITYRCVFLLLLFPGFWDLRTVASLKGMFGLAIGITIFCLWSDFFRQWGEFGIDRVEDWIAPDRSDALAWDTPYILFFVVRELLWWWLAAVMSAVVMIFVLDSRAIRDARDGILGVR